MIDLGSPSRAIDRHPRHRRHLQRQSVVLKGRHKTDNALWNQNRCLRETVGSVDVGVGELVETPGRAHDRLLPDKPGQRLRADARGDEILEAEHASVPQKVECTQPLGDGGRHGA